MVEQTEQKTDTEADYFSLGEDVRAEIIDGEIVIDMTPNKLEHSAYGLQAAFFLKVFVSAHDLGRVIGDMTVFKLEKDQEGGLRGARVPDAAYISFERLPRDASLAIFPDFAPDLAIEVISESESFNDVLKKTYYYLDHGTVQVWLILPDLQEIRVFTTDNRAGTVYTETDTLSGGALLPGFSVPVRAIFDTGDTALHVEVLKRLLS